ncbi:MAG: ribonuclease Y [Actinomycetota bacterium]
MLGTVIAAIAALVVGLAVGALAVRFVMGSRNRAAEEEALREVELRRVEADALRAEAQSALTSAQREADATRKEAEIDAKERLHELRRDLEQSLDGRRVELSRLEERAVAREDALGRGEAAVAERETELAQRELALADGEALLAEARSRVDRELERVGGMTADEARTQVLARVEETTRHDAAQLVRRIEEEAKQDAERRARTIIATGIQRTASSYAAATTVSSVALPSDDLKGRIIGREGRNIRALEAITGVDVIIDDTPGAVILSAFDGVRREVARMTLEKLIADGRIHPARIEESYYQAKEEIDVRIREAGEQASFEANVPGLDPELMAILGRLNYRTSYGQNVLRHSLECAHLAAIMAVELGADERVARRAALLHDIGKAVTHEVEGPHAVISAQFCRKHGESEAVCHAVEAHHYDVEPDSVEAVLVIAADAISAARPGARGESLEQYIKRLEALEEIAMRRNGVERCFAMQAGRDVRVMVKPGEVDDDMAALLAREIAQEIEDSLEYPGQIKVTVIRESRTSELAR